MSADEWAATLRGRIAAEHSQEWHAAHAEQVRAELDDRGLTREDILASGDVWALYGATGERRHRRALTELAVQIGSKPPKPLFIVGRSRYWLYDDILAWLAPTLARRWDVRYELRRRDVVWRWNRSHPRRRKAPRAGGRYGYQGVSRVVSTVTTKRPYRVNIGLRGNAVHLGNRATPEEAGRLYDRALIALGERPVNFPDDVATTMLVPEPHIGPKTSVTDVMLQIVEKHGPIELDDVLDLLPTWPFQPTRPTTRQKARNIFHNTIRRGIVEHTTAGWVLSPRRGVLNAGSEGP